MVSTDKYELIPTAGLTPEGKPLWQLRALRDFSRVRAGDLGALSRASTTCRSRAMPGCIRELRSTGTAMCRTERR